MWAKIVLVLIFQSTLVVAQDFRLDPYSYLGLLDVAYTNPIAHLYEPKNSKKNYLVAFQNFLVKNFSSGHLINNGFKFKGLKYPTRVFPLNRVSVVQLFDEEISFPKFLRVLTSEDKWILTSLPMEVEGYFTYPRLSISCNQSKKIEISKHSGIIEEPLVDRKQGINVVGDGNIVFEERLLPPTVVQVYFDLSAIPNKSVCVAKIIYERSDALGEKVELIELLKFRK